MQEKKISDLKKTMTRKTQRQTAMKVIYQMSITKDYSKIKDVYLDYKKQSKSYEITTQNIDEFNQKDYIKDLISSFASNKLKEDFDIDKMQEDDKVLYKKTGQNEYKLENLEEYDNISYLKLIIDNFVKNIDNIDEKIKNLLYDNWDIKRLSKVDLCIIRVAIIDIEYMQVPYKVAINEALDMAKEYSDEKSSKFINGVLKEYTKKFVKQEEK